MQADSNEIYQAALGLSEMDRLILVTRLLETMSMEDTGLSLDDPRLIEELDRRSSDHAGAVDWSDLKSQQ